MRVFLIAALLMVSGASCDKPPVEDPPPGINAVTVFGCQGTAGAIGIGTLAGDVGDTVTVALTTTALDRVDAWLVDLAYPVNYLKFVEATEGALLGEDWEFFAGSTFGGGLRVGGQGGHGFIEAGAGGSLCEITFVVDLASGVDIPYVAPFAFLNFHDDVQDYEQNCYDPLIKTARVYPLGRVVTDTTIAGIEFVDGAEHNSAAAIVDVYLECNEGEAARCLSIDMAYGAMGVFERACALNPLFDEWSAFDWSRHPSKNVLRIGGFTTDSGVTMDGLPIWIGTFVFVLSDDDAWAEIARTEICLTDVPYPFASDRIAAGERWEK
ncbi:MAG: hypothetical protein GY838_13560 [bacterium]|nr:hypothetical protein [bacterium]